MIQLKDARIQKNAEEKDKECKKKALVEYDENTIGIELPGVDGSRPNTMFLNEMILLRVSALP